MITVCCWCPWVVWLVQIPICLSAVESGLILAEECTYLHYWTSTTERPQLNVHNWTSTTECQNKAIGGNDLKKSEHLRFHSGVESDNFLPWLKNGIFNCISWLNGLPFQNGDSGFLNKVSDDLSQRQCEFLTCQFQPCLVCLHIYSLWRRHQTNVIYQSPAADAIAR
jgi:hypothetical protein